MKFFHLLILSCVCAFQAGAVPAFPEVNEDAIAEMGITVGTPQLTGFVFIEGRYLPPPYTVTRKGNVLFINRIPFEKPVAWSYFDAAPNAPAAKKAVDADGDFQEVSAKPEKSAAAEAPAQPAASEKPKAVKSIDDLFSDDDKKPEAKTETKPAEAPAAAEKSEAPGEDAAAPKAVAASVSASQRTPEDIKRLKDELKAKLDAMRKNYEEALGRGDFFFFSAHQNRLNGNYGTARALMQVLPGALRQSQSPQELLQLLNQGNVYFVDMGICAALFQNKNTFPQLQERLQKLQEDEKYEAERRNRSSIW